jgi:hypothetical protein
MIKLAEIIIGLALVYVGLDKFSSADQIKGVIFGLLAIVGLILAVHGILLFNVPNFFETSM